MNKCTCGREFTTPQGLGLHHKHGKCRANLYSCWKLFTVRSISGGGDDLSGCIPMIILPKSLVGKTVKVTIEEQQ